MLRRVVGGRGSLCWVMGYRIKGSVIQEKAGPCPSIKF